jgi:hypothetical protein
MLATAQADRRIAEQRIRHPQTALILQNSVSTAACVTYAGPKLRILRDNSGDRNFSGKPVD